MRNNVTIALKEARYDKRLTQTEVAKKLGISFGHYNGIENARARPSVELAKEIETLLGVDWHIFF